MVRLWYALLLSLIATAPATAQKSLNLPYAEAGLTDTQAAAHLLDRLAYGPRPGEVQQIADQGMETWLLSQLFPKSDDLATALAVKYPATTMPLADISQTYPGPGVRLIFMSQRMKGLRGEGAMGSGTGRQQMDSAMRPGKNGGQQAMLNRILNAEPNPNADNPRGLARNERFGFEPLEDLTYQAMAQKLERAVYSENQLVEQLTDFWFNHFNVTITSVNEATPHVLSYERDAIRPHVLGNFRDMLGATAKHPAMLLYLNQHRSNAEEGAPTLQARRQLRRQQEDANGFGQKPGINENYARELLELHTLGVDGGYTQGDIEEIARALTGWKMSPATYPLPEPAREMMERAGRHPDAVLTEGFYFNPRWHDSGEKTILGEHFPAGGGVEEGERILDMLAAHPSTAHHLAAKMAEKFIGEPDTSDVSSDVSVTTAMATAFTESGGDLRAMLIAMIEHPAFWQSRTQKIKTPLEYVASALRATATHVDDPRHLLRWLTRMGQPLYAYQAPTGYPERASHWTNGAALINRINFGLELAAGDIPGTQLDLLALNRHHEPASAKDALATYLPLLLPARDTEETHELLLPELRDPEHPTSLARVVGLILGSPEFQWQ